MRKPVVVDTNVLKAANGEATCSLKCQVASVTRLREIQLNGRVVLDHGYEILGEYGKVMKPGVQPGVGSAFWKWLINNRSQEDSCEHVRINKSAERGYDEFPEHDGLKHFDPPDRKFVAVANAHPGRPPILQGVDSKWWGWKESLCECGITVEFLCPQEVEAMWEKKIGKRVR